MKRIFLAYLPKLTVDFLEKNILLDLSPTEKEMYKAFKHPSRRKEWLAVRWILKNRLGFVPELLYTPDGKPYFSSLNKEISISHSRWFAAVCISNKPCAVDIDAIDRNYKSLANRYLSEQEQRCYASDRKKLALSWIAKEAIYKLVSEKNISFASEILLELPADLNKFGYFYGTFYRTQYVDCVLSYYFLKNNFLVVAEYENQSAR